ncbi:MAG: hypothetical protein ACT4OJ_15585 [Bacteroidota bacterium]
MSILLKKIAASFMLAIVLAPLGYAFVFHARQQSIRHRMKEQLEEKMIHTIVLAEKDVKWFKPGKEIVVEGKMFDVKSVIHRNDGTVTFTGLFDEEETLLVKQMQQRQQEENTKGGKQIVQLLQQAQALPEESTADECAWRIISASLFAFYSPSLPKAYTTILTPPPQF